MWAHYANNHHGFCIECLVTRKVAVQKVAYKNKREPIANIWLNFMHYCSEFDATKSKEAFKKIGMYRTLLLQMYFTKHDSWSYENEYRIVYPIDCHVDKGLNIKASDVGIQISKIYCGVKCKEEYINKLHAVGATIGAEVEDCQISGDDFIVSY